LRQDLRCAEEAAVAVVVHCSAEEAEADEEEAKAEEEEEEEEEEAEAGGDGVGDSRVRFVPAEEAGARPSASSPPPSGDGACVDDIGAGAAAARL
jgi:hypothetical protein